MDGILWSLRTLDSFAFAWPILLNLAICLGFAQIDFVLLGFATLARGALGSAGPFRPAKAGSGERPTGLVVIPSLLRGEDDFEAITTTVESCARNEYPEQLVIVASVDGRTEHPHLYAKLLAWVEDRAATWPENVQVYVAGTETRLGKMMAVEAGLDHMRELVASGHPSHARFPDLYFSIDGDGTLGAHALERLAARLTRPHPITGNPRRVVSGKICIRPDLVWRGWRKLLTVEGQIYAQVAREFIVSNVARHNWKLTPKIGIPGALYCTWSDLITQAPRYMGFMQSLRFSQWLGWWIGRPPPKFSESDAKALPEALTGASDDTCIAFLASIGSWKNGRLDFDAPPTPLHALARLLRGYFFERSHDYEPEARVYTFTPVTMKGLWIQRVRWNSSRFECAGRFWRAFWFHWEIGLPVGSHLWLVLQTVLEMTTYYVLLPYLCFGNANAALAYLVGYSAQALAFALYTLLALGLEKERKDYWAVLLVVPLAPLHSIVINFFGCVYGVSRDLLFFGNATKFAPEWTLMRGGCERVALGFRVRRFLALAVRSVLVNDVPFGSFWFGWKETPWTPSGFEGWTTGKAPRAIVPWSALVARLRGAPPAAAAGSTPPPLSSDVREIARGASVHELAPASAREGVKRAA